MVPLLNSIKRYGITSPYGPVLFSCGLFLFGWFFPPQLYTALVLEPDRMFLDPLTALFFFLCAGAFVLGLRFQRSLKPQASSVLLPEFRSLSPVLHLCLPLVVAIAYAAADLNAYGNKFNVLGILLAHQGEELKNMQAQGIKIGAGTLFGPAAVVLISVLWWYLFRLRQLKLSGAVRGSLIFLWGVGAVLQMLTDIAEVNRNHLMSMLAGIMLVFLFARESRDRKLGRSRFGRIVIQVGLSFCVLCGLFVLVSILRGNVDGLRAIAILLVMACHYPGLERITGNLTAWGWVGVDIFFAFRIGASNESAFECVH